MKNVNYFKYSVSIYKCWLKVDTPEALYGRQLFEKYSQIPSCKPWFAQELEYGDFIWKIFSNLFSQIIHLISAPADSSTLITF